MEDKIRSRQDIL